MAEPRKPAETQNPPKRNRFPIQVAALVIALISPFGLYASLANNQPGFAVFFFVALALSMGMTFWAS